MDSPDTGTFAPGQVVFLHAATGLVVLNLIQNRSSRRHDQGDLLKKLDPEGLLNLRPGSDPRTEFSRSSGTSTPNYHVGSIAYVTSPGTSRPVGEYSLVVANSATTFILASERPLSAPLFNQSDITVYPVYQSEINDANHQPTEQLLGVTIGEHGISPQNFGFAQCFGVCPVVRQSGGFSSRNQFVSSDAGDGGRVVQSTAGDDTDTIVGKAITTVVTSTTDFFVGHIAVGPMATVSRADTVF